MENHIYGYIRVSTLAQHDDRQWLAMDEFGVSREFVCLPTSSRERILPGLPIRKC